MVGREVMFQVERPVVETGKPVLQVEKLSALSSRGFMAVKDVSFTVREGEIFGIAGVSGNGQHELAEVLAGLRKAEAGKVTLDDNEITDALPLKRWQAGLGYIPSERNEVGSIGEFSLVENMAMNYYFDETYTHQGIVDYGSIRKLTEQLIVDYGVATPNADVKAKNLSGGNLQKIILARVLNRNPRLVIANLPTQGLDVGATEFVQNKLIEAKKNCAAVLLISEDLDEIMAISDWIAPMYEGEFMAILPAEGADRELIGAMMAGLQQPERQEQ